MTHEHRAVPGPTSHLNKAHDCSQYLSLSPHPFSKLAGPVPGMQLRDREPTRVAFHVDTPLSQSIVPQAEAILKLIKQMFSGSLGEPFLRRMASLGGSRCWFSHNEMGRGWESGIQWKPLNTLAHLSVQWFSPVISTSSQCSSVPAGLQGKISNKARLWLLKWATRDVQAHSFWLDSLCSKSELQHFVGLHQAWRKGWR